MKTILISIMMFFLFLSSGFGQTLEERIKVLEDALKKQEETIKVQQKLIEDLKAEMKQANPPEQPGIKASLFPSHAIILKIAISRAGRIR